MISAQLTTRRVPAVVRALWSAPTRRATGNALAALLVAAMGTALLGGLVVVIGAAIYSLVDWPVGGWANAALYLAVVLAAPILVLWVVQGLAAIQRTRLHATLGLELPAGGPSARRKPWPVGPWRDAVTWRQLGYHLLAVLVGGAGGGLVAACWLAPVAAIGY
ncbi:MAG: sensor domain-containing protein, partial [Actinobacteria bacterium]|nr:sensor domain-containing protein [Actinomycetota bacterium]